MFTLSQYPLPYTTNELAPYISQRTMELHHGRHLATYINNLNDLIKDTEYEMMPLDKIIITSAKNPNDKKIFDNAAQIFNHDFFFHSMRGRGTGKMPDAFASQFGGDENFRKQFKEAAKSIFGSGWAWVVRDGNGLKIITTANADTPIAHGQIPVLTLDVWEHAYYIDYQNKRPDYIDAWLDNVVNWDFVMENIK